jgi:hypothetical protein
MSIRPIEFNNSTRIYRMNHDEMGHIFDILESDIHFAEGTDRFINVPCLICGSLSVHPAGGGADPASIQPMFVRMYVKEFAMSISDAITHAKNIVTEMDGEGRWQVNEEKFRNAA